MNYLPQVEQSIQKTIEMLSNSSEPDNSLLNWEAFRFGYDMIIMGWFDNAESIVDTLITLLSNRDRRVILLAILYIGLIHELIGVPTGRGNTKRAIDPIYNTVAHTNDNNLGIAVGVTNAILGDKRSIMWLHQQMVNSKASDENDFIKTCRLGAVMEIVEGWR
jgi:hypothetical protein